MKKSNLYNILKKINLTDLSKMKMMIGFDGFVDEVIYVVDKRIDETNYQRLNYMEEYGNRIVRSAGLSMNIEMITMQQKIGGNGPIFSNSLIAMGCDVTYIGAVGDDEVHLVFKGMAEKCCMISLAKPAHTDAIEFLDGKIISSKLENLNEVNWANIVDKIGIEKITDIIENSDVIGFENWTMIVHMTEIWKHLLEEVLPCIKGNLKKKILFIDLADPEKRENTDILEAIGLLEEFAKYFNVILGLNKKEAYGIAELFGYSVNKISNTDTKELIKFLKKRIAVDTLVIHPVKEACAMAGEEVYLVDGPYCEHPKLTTGAGDNFNAGFLLGQVIGCTLEESLLLGTANSGFYVRNAKSANIPELCEFLSDWERGILD